MNEKITKAAKTLAVSAQKNAELAEKELVNANAELTVAIKEEDTRHAKSAHARTQRAEKAVGEAKQQIEVVEVLLDAAEGSNATG